MTQWVCGSRTGLDGGRDGEGGGAAIGEAPRELRVIVTFEANVYILQNKVQFSHFFKGYIEIKCIIYKKRCIFCRKKCKFYRKSITFTEKVQI